MTTMNRRTFCRWAATAVGAGIVSRAVPSVWAKPLGANDAVRVAVVGCNTKGAALAWHLTEVPGVRLAALCDVDPQILGREVEAFRAQHIEVFSTTDVRELLPRDDIDAVVIATPNHWHALLTVWCCQAGKDVYVEKPVSHTVWESRKMIEAAAKYKRVVQSGSQLRSDVGIAEAVDYVRSGQLGKIQWIHGVCYTRRAAVPAKAAWYPKGLNYDLWCGPAAMAPLERAQLHYDWHWQWETGNGDLANIGVHVVDIARRFTDAEALPRRVTSVGGRFGFRDAAETPNTLLALYDYAAFPLVVEVRNLPAKPDVTYMDHVRGTRRGVVVQCENGCYVGYTGGAVFDRNGKRITHFPGDGGYGHMRNFIEAVRSRRVQDLAAPIEVGTGSADLCHYANIAHRIGSRASRDQAREAFGQWSVAEEAFARFSKHLDAHQIDPARDPLVLGPWLNLDPKTGNISSADAGTNERIASLVRPLHRPPYEIPSEV